MTLTNRTYDTLKWIALVVLPATATLFAALGALWDWPYIIEIVGSITAVSTFVGALLGLSSENYKNKENTDHV